MSLPTVSIIIPAYNYQDYLVEAVYSCTIQKYAGKIEVIIVDDYSTDNTIHIVKGMRIKCPDLIYIRHDQNRGYSVAKNTGIRQSTGELICLLDADDMLTEDSIAIRADYLCVHPEIDMVYGTAYLIDETGGFDYYNKRRYKLHIHAGVKIHAQTTMLRRSVHLRFGLYDETLRSRSDNEMWNRLNLYGLWPGLPLISADKICSPQFAFYRKHPNSMIEYRKKNKLYNLEQSNRLNDAKEMRHRFGITQENTPWLKK
jgi:glycosyltransferase involved in cell wall biosynthesis